MKGLLRNNFLAVYANAKVFSVFMLALGIFVAAVISPSLLIGYVLLGMVGFSVNAMTGIKKEFISKWGKYKLTLPIKRADIVKSYFVSHLIWLLVGALFAGAVIALSWSIHGCPFDNGIDVVSLFALGISVSLFMGAFFFPLFCLGGEDKGEVLLGISLLCGIGAALGIISVINLYAPPGVLTILAGAAALAAGSVLAFLLSCPLTVSIYNKREY